MDDWPSHTDELSRKVLTTLEKIVNANLQFNKPTSQEVRDTAGYLYDTVAGLVPTHVTDVLLYVHGGGK